MQIAMLQCNSVAGDITGNAARIAQAVRTAQQMGASLCITPELALCGVAPRELLAATGFLNSCKTALQQLALELRDGPPVLVGVPVLNPPQSGRRVSNAGVLLEKGTCRIISRKVYQAQASVAEDSRYFDCGISCGIITVEGWRLGVVLCGEDDDNTSFWTIQYATAHNPLMELIRRGVDAVVHMTATPFYIGGQNMRENTLSHVAARHHIHLFSVNAVGGNDGQICHGQSLAFDPTGQLLARGKAFEEDVTLVNTALTAKERTITSACACPEEECWRALVLGTRDYIHKSGCSRAVLGLSGGMDSALVCAIAVEALGAENVLGVLMPSVYTSQESIDDALLLAKRLGIETMTISISPAVDAFTSLLDPVVKKFPARAGDTTFDNVQARARGALLMAIANRSGALVLNTGNKSECAVGYSTLYGDTVGAVAVIGDVPKTFVYKVAAWCNAQHGTDVIPHNIFVKEPTAELHPGQKDSDHLPPYDVLDPVMLQIISQSPERESGEQDDPVMHETVRSKLFAAEFKRRQEPVALQVSRRPFGRGWSIPMVMRWNLPKQ